MSSRTGKYRRKPTLHSHESAGIKRKEGNMIFLRPRLGFNENEINKMPAGNMDRAI